MPSPIPCSVVINTYNRARQLDETLASLVALDYPNFEIIVVNGPSTDDTASVMARWAHAIRPGVCLERNLSMSRNVGIEMAAGDIVLFIDDDAVAEPEWLTQIVEGFDSDDVGAVGGTVYDHTGYTFQYQYSTATRLGNSNWKYPQAGTLLNFPGTAEFPYLQGTNTAFRRDALLRIGGFDEEIEFYLDETEVCLRMIDAGYLVRQLPTAFVHHKFAPSDVRDENRVVKYRYPVVKNKMYFALRHASPFMTESEISQDNEAFVEAHRRDVQFHIDGGRLTNADMQAYERDVLRARERALAASQLPPKHISGPLSSPSDFKQTTAVIAASEKLRVVFFCQDYPPNHQGGVARFTCDLAEALARLGHKIHVITKGSGHNRVDLESGVWVHRLLIDAHPQPEEVRSLGLPQHIWNLASTFHAELERIAQHRRVDVVQAPIWDVEGIATLFSRRFRLITSLQTTLNLSIASHPEWANDAEFMTRFAAPVIAAERMLLERSNGLHSISHGITTAIEEAYGLNLQTGPRLGLVPLGLRDTEANFTIDKQKKRSDAQSLLFVGRLEFRKGIDTLLEAIPGVLEQLPDLTLTIVGDDSLKVDNGRTIREGFEARYAAAPWFPRVKFAGRVSDTALQQHYRDCDVFVAPSRFESFGLIYLEGMRCAKPVVGCRVGGVPEVVEHGQCGLLVAPADPVELRQALLKLLKDPVYAAKLGAAGRKRFEEKFSDVAMAKNAERYYRRVLAGPLESASVSVS